MIRVLMLVEGQTEERFVKDVLAPEFWKYEITLIPTILVTKRVKSGPNFKGGVTSFLRFETDLRRLLSDKTALVTTLLDFYGLPNDFPGMDTLPRNGSPTDRVSHVERSLQSHFSEAQNFRPFLALHEFEAWLFSDIEVIPGLMAEPGKKREFARIRDSVSTPEEINERPEFAPSKRIRNLFPTYRKTIHGPAAAMRIGIEKIQNECPHFAEWVNDLTKLSDEAEMKRQF